jgi:hypothetical protein
MWGELGQPTMLHPSEWGDAVEMYMVMIAYNYLLFILH